MQLQLPQRRRRSRCSDSGFDRMPTEQRAISSQKRWWEMWESR